MCFWPFLLICEFEVSCLFSTMLCYFASKTMHRCLRISGVFVWKEFFRFFEGSSGLYAPKATVGSKCLCLHGDLVSFPVQRLYYSFVLRCVIFGLFKGSTSLRGDNNLFRESNKSLRGAFKLLREAYKPRDGAKQQLLRESCASVKEIEQCLETVIGFTTTKALSKQIHLVNNVKCFCKNAFLITMPKEKMI